MGEGAAAQGRVLLIVAGGIAAYKTLELVRVLRKAGIAVTAVLTEAGARFVTALSLQALTEDRVYTDLWSLTDEHEMGHIQLSRAADLIVVAPATADIMARAAHGLAGDLATTLLLATDTPVLMAPAMNLRMWLHPATQANAALLAARGVRFVGPDSGEMACHEFGPGRLAEPPAIAAAVMTQLRSPARAEDRVGSDATRQDVSEPTGQALAHTSDPPTQPAAGAALNLQGRHILVTAGPTQEPIDAVRFIANRSSGRQGYAIAAALAALGARVTLVSGPTALADPVGPEVIRIETAREMLRAAEAALPADAAICAAAVADWRIEEPLAGKMKKQAGPPALALIPNPDILAQLAAPGPSRPALVIGFAAESEDLLANAAAKRAAKNCDWIIANAIGPGSTVMGGTRNQVTLVRADGAETWPDLPKEVVAARLAERVAAALAR